MRIYSYYEHCLDGFLDFKEEYRLAVLWQKEWSAIGFEPVILNEAIARRHPYFANYDVAVSKLPSVNPPSYERSCYLRHLALVQAGGGWLSDLDVLPNAPGDLIRETLLASFVSSGGGIIIGQALCCPSLIYHAPKDGLWLCEQFATGQIGNSPQGERDHYSDQYGLSQLLDAKTPRVTVQDIVRLYGDKEWEKAPLTHFANSCMGEKKPRWKWIPKLRK